MQTPVLTPAEWKAAKATQTGLFFGLTLPARLGQTGLTLATRISRRIAAGLHRNSGPRRRADGTHYSAT